MKRSRLPLIAAIVAGVAIAGIASAAPSESKYLVTAPHTKEECLKALDEAKATSKKLLEKLDWGCMAGDHTGYLMVDYVGSYWTVVMETTVEDLAAFEQHMKEYREKKEMRDAMGGTWTSSKRGIGKSTASSNRFRV